MCVEVRLGAKVAETCGDLAALIRSNVIYAGGIIDVRPSSCLCNVDFDRTLELAGFEIDQDDCEDYEIAIRKKLDPKDGTE